MTRFTVISGGMHRSGSTWLYNTVRIGLGDDVYAAFEDAYDPANRRSKHVVKAHGWQEWFREADVVVMTMRDIRGVVASALRRGLVAADPDTITAWLGKVLRVEFSAWERSASLIVRYENMIRKREASTVAVLEAIGSEADPATVAAAVDALQPPSVGMDGLTQLHAHHRTGSDWMWDLSFAQLDTIESRFGWWLREYGYPLRSEILLRFSDGEVVHEIAAGERPYICGLVGNRTHALTEDAVTCPGCMRPLESYRRRALRAEGDVEKLKSGIEAACKSLSRLSLDVTRGKP